MLIPDGGKSSYLEGAAQAEHAVVSLLRRETFDGLLDDIALLGNQIIGPRKKSVSIPLAHQSGRSVASAERQPKFWPAQNISNCSGKKNLTIATIQCKSILGCNHFLEYHGKRALFQKGRTSIRDDDNRQHWCTTQRSAAPSASARVVERRSC
jgi:hypothetical protein